MYNIKHVISQCKTAGLGMSLCGMPSVLVLIPQSQPWFLLLRNEHPLYVLDASRKHNHFHHSGECPISLYWNMNGRHFLNKSTVAMG